MTELPKLHWFPKPLGAGDTAGEGAQRLLGQPDITPQALLVRETAQNSWDARLSVGVPQFELRLRELDEDAREVLRWNVFTETAPNLGLMDALNRSKLTAIEVVDRGTKGLGGPTRNDLVIPTGVPRDYADFVLTVGAPPERFEGGGTYGFGKMASYSASRCGTILIWSRSKDSLSGELVERFIASAMGSTFVVDGAMFTGRQWWGLLPEPDGPAARIEPLEGAEARRFGELLFERGFEGEETGTSLLILDPYLGEGHSQTVEEWIATIRSSLWPKLVETQGPDRRMDLRVFDRGAHVPISDMDESPTGTALKLCLNQIRKIQSGEASEHPTVRVHEIRSLNPKRLLGHLALTLLPGVESGDDFESSWDSVTYMRSGAELVVRAQEFGPMYLPGMRWTGVFKPVPELDHAFAASEPPAHDNWNPAGVPKATDRSAVRVALREIKSFTQAYLKPPATQTDADESISTGALSAALTGLVGSSAGGRATAGSPGKARTGPGKGPRGAAAKVRILSIEHLPLTQADRDDGVQRISIRLELDADGPRRACVTRLAFAVDGGSMSGEEQIHLDEWVVGGVVSDADVVMVTPGQPFSATIAAPTGCAVDVNFGIEADS